LRDAAISWSRARGICRAVRGPSLEHLDHIDTAVVRHARALSPAEPDELVWRTEDEVAGIRADRELRREDHSIEAASCGSPPA